MRKLRIKFVALCVAGALLPAVLFDCGKVARKFQLGFWEGLGANVSGLVTDAARGNLNIQP